jgi:hypothetical protein
MYPVKEQFYQTYGLLSEHERYIIWELMQSFVDDIVVPDDISAHLEAVEDYKNKSYISHNEINWD